MGKYVWHLCVCMYGIFVCVMIILDTISLKIRTRKITKKTNNWDNCQVLEARISHIEISLFHISKLV